MHIGLIGCGLWGRNILRDLLMLGAKVSVVETDPHLRDQALQLGATTVAAAPDAEVDGWIVATPASSHAAVIASIGESAVPILCEKPLCTDLAQAQAITACLRGPLHLMDVWRYHPVVEALRVQVLAETLGPAQGLRLTRANWTSPRTDVDSAWNLAPHEISIFREVFGVMPEPRAALAEWLDDGIRSLWSHWRAPHGPWLVSEVSNRFEQRRRELRLHCARGVWVSNGVDPVLHGYSGPADSRLETQASQTVQLDTESALQRQLAAWLGFLAGGPAPRSDLAHGIGVIERIVELRRLAGP